MFYRLSKYITIVQDIFECLEQEAWTALFNCEHENI